MGLTDGGVREDDDDSSERAARGLSKGLVGGVPRSSAGAVGASEALLDVYRIVDRIAPTSSAVLITGESGTGKDLVARAVHAQSSNASGPFVAVDCRALPEAVLERELFGCASDDAGRVAMARGGTLYLDEVGDLSRSLQVKLLHVLQSVAGRRRRLKAGVRVVAATRRSLEEAVRDGWFHEDLYRRLAVIELRVPALRERREDIPLLTHYFLRRAGGKSEGALSGVSRAAAELLMEYSWPGNVRELEMTIERAALLCSGERIEPRDLPARVRGLGADRRVAARLPEAGLDLRVAVESFENQMIRQALERTNWNKKRAARLLGLNRTTLVEMVRRRRLA